MPALLDEEFSLDHEAGAGKAGRACSRQHGQLVESGNLIREYGHFGTQHSDATATLRF
jgi:hypothetical protein